MQKEGKKRWDEKNQEAVTAAVKELDDFNKVEEPPKLMRKNSLGSGSGG